MQMFCNNCADKGHPFRECKKPVLSCGIILLRNKKEPNRATSLPLVDIEMLMIRRKDSMSFTEFVRGKYEPNDTVYVKRLLDNMTQSELTILQTVPFEQVWTRIWATDRHEREFIVAKERFDRIVHIVKDSKSPYTEPEWGFPKGRRFRTETDIQCAEREFYEETNIPRSSYTVVTDVVFTETFLGTNGIPYEHKYFLAIQKIHTNIHQKFTSAQKREISAIGWKTLNDCMALTRPHYSGRESLLNELAVFTRIVEVQNPNVAEKDNGIINRT